MIRQGDSFGGSLHFEDSLNFFSFLFPPAWAG
jgi:hypothetical protein